MRNAVEPGLLTKILKTPHLFLISLGGYIALILGPFIFAMSMIFFSYDVLTAGIVLFANAILGLCLLFVSRLVKVNEIWKYVTAGILSSALLIAGGYSGLAGGLIALLGSAWGIIRTY